MHPSCCKASYYLPANPVPFYLIYIKHLHVEFSALGPGGITEFDIAPAPGLLTGWWGLDGGRGGVWRG